MRSARPVPSLWLLLLLSIGAVLSCRTPPAPTITRQPSPQTRTAATATETPAPAPTSAPSPEASATRPSPTATADPDLTGWTVMVYLGADPALADRAETDLAELAAVGTMPMVNVLAQVGETTPEGAISLRSVFSPASDAPLEELPGVAPGDPAALADFIAWGMATYPARHVALVLWGAGAGGDGLVFAAGEGGGLTLPDLTAALHQGLEQSGRDGLDLIAFAAGLMGRLEVAEAVQPFASLDVAPADLLPADGWDFASLLAQLKDDPDMSPVQLARHLAAGVPDGRPSAIDLSGVPALRAAIDELAIALLAEPGVVASAVAAARRDATIYGLAAPSPAAGVATVDLERFIAALAAQVPDPAVAALAGDALAALDAISLVPATGVAGSGSGGLAAGFSGPLPGAGAATPWDQFVAGYLAPELVAPPELTFTRVLTAAASWQEPAFLAFTLAGRAPASVVWRVLQEGGEGTRRLLAQEPLAFGDDPLALHWPDGLSQGRLVWDTALYVLASGADVAPAFTRPASADGALRAVSGRFLPAEGAPVPASLVFPAAGGAPGALWGLSAGGVTAPYPIVPLPGDSFQVDDWLVQEDDNLRATPGRIWPLAADLTLRRQPAPTGDYSLRLLAVAPGGAVAAAEQAIAVDNDTLLPGLRAVVVPDLGFSIHYPEAWRPTEREAARLVGRDDAGELALVVSRLPASATTSPASLAADVLAAFGEVSPLYSSDTQVAGAPARRVAYGYDDEDGLAHTGVFATFAGEGQAFVVDVDGPQAREAETLAALDTALAGWRFLPLLPDPPPDWVRDEAGGLRLTRPAAWRAESLDGDWLRLLVPGQNQFVALRSAPGGGTAQAALDAWGAVAADGVTGFAADPAKRIALGDRIWTRQGFRYDGGDGGTVAGALWVADVEGREVVAWVEAPGAGLAALEGKELAVILSGLESGQ